MNNESFLETLRTQYADEIHEAYVECEHDGAVDFGKLNGLLKKLFKNAKVEGFPAKEFEDLVRATLPEAWEKVEFMKQAPKAA
jgi:hypothetical protein